MNRQQRRAAAKAGPESKDAECARLYAYAQAKAAGGNFREAAASFRRLDRLQPNVPDILVGLGCALQALGKVDEAIAAFRQRIALDPSLPGVWSYSNLCGALMRQGTDLPVLLYFAAPSPRPRAAKKSFCTAGGRFFTSARMEV